MSHSDPESELPAESALPPLPTGPNLINTSNERQDGLNKCHRCGSTSVAVNGEALTCMDCRYSWTEAKLSEKHELSADLDDLKGLHLGTGARSVDVQATSVVTLKCQGCGAEVVVDTATNLTSRCHWCRQTLSLNSQIANGAVPDAVLPFKLTRDEAVKAITEFTKKRRVFASKQFKKEFKPENVVGVFLPYMVIDGNLTGTLWGEGEHKTRTYSRGTGKNKTTYYDADVYSVGRKFDFTVDDLTVEASATRADIDVKVNTQNVINTILPFDTENAVQYNSGYLGTYTTEKRDLDVDSMTPRVMEQLLSVARSEAEPTLSFYDRGVKWEKEHVEVHGSRWLSVLLPVWLYSYQDANGLIHYIAVNGRTGETMGSVPVNQTRLVAASIVIALVGTLFSFLVVVEPDTTETYSFSYGNETGISQEYYCEGNC